MFVQLNIPILGIIENMSFFICPECKTKTHIFSSQGGHELAKKMNTEFLGSLPLTEMIRAGGDNGEPVALNDNDPGQKAFTEIANNVVQTIKKI